MNNPTFDQKDTTNETKKSATENQCKDTGIVSGIYKIVNKVNGKFYVGSSNNIRRRWKEHRHNLLKGNHDNDHLQNAWNKYGKESFLFEVTESNIIEDNLLIIEQNYLDKINKDECYNTSYIAGKVEMTEEVKKKISDKMTGKTLSEEAKKKLTGRILSEETRKRISDGMKGNKNSLGIKLPYKKRKSLSLEHRKKLSESHKKRLTNHN